MWLARWEKGGLHAKTLGSVVGQCSTVKMSGIFSTPMLETVSAGAVDVNWDET
jgi:hypothetical protein